MSNINADIMMSLRLATMHPLDPKTFFRTTNEMIDLGTDNNKALTYYEGMPAYCLEDDKVYRWKEMEFGENGLIPGSYAYPPGTIVDEIVYGERVFNFVPYVGGADNSDLFYIEPSVNIRIEDDPDVIEEALHFGNMDIGAGQADYALIKNSFAAQSGYDMLAAANVGDEIKIYNATGRKYLGQFKLTANIYQDYYVMTIVEKGDWTPEGVTFNTQKVIINLLRETNYNVSLAGNVINLLRGTQVVGSVDLTALLGGAVGATIVSGVLNPANGMVTFTMSDASTFIVDFSALLTAEDYIKKEGILSVKGRDLYENALVNRMGFAVAASSFYALDITTNYNSGNFLAFPYPASRDNIICKYESKLYLLVKKTSAVKEVLQVPNRVIAFSIYKNRAASHSANKRAYFNVLSRSIALTGLNSQYAAYLIWNRMGTNIPGAASGGYFNEIGIVEGVNESSCNIILNQVYEEQTPRLKDIALPYTVTNEDFELVLCPTNAGIITVPSLVRGFWCGILQKASDASNVAVNPAGGVSIATPSGKSTNILGQYWSVLLSSLSTTLDPASVGTTVSYLLTGDLKDS